MNNKFTYVDLFAGIGGFRLALNSIGGECVNFTEINKDAITTYCTNFNEDPLFNLGDITKIKSLPEHDLLTGGVPCQSWSIAGKNLGFDDDRGQLWNDTIYLLNQSRPKGFIFENNLSSFHLYAAGRTSFKNKFGPCLGNSPDSDRSLRVVCPETLLPAGLGKNDPQIHPDPDLLLYHAFANILDNAKIKICGNYCSL